MHTRNSPTTEPTWRDVLHWAREGNPPPPRRDARDEAAWRAALDPEAFRVLRGKGTEAPHSSPMCSLFERGVVSIFMTSLPQRRSKDEMILKTGKSLVALKMRILRINRCIR